MADDVSDEDLAAARQAGQHDAAGTLERAPEHPLLKVAWAQLSRRRRRERSAKLGVGTPTPYRRHSAEWCPVFGPFDGPAEASAGLGVETEAVFELTKFGVQGDGDLGAEVLVEAAAWS